MQAKKIAIIGAGWMGIGCLRVLRDEGYEVDVFEKNDDVGGTWHPSNCYAGLMIHQASKAIEYYDFPLPDNVDRLQRIQSNQVFNYVKDYCKLNELYKNIKFNFNVTKISYNTQSKKSRIFFKDESCKNEVEYDYVIYTHGFCSRTLPKLKGKDIYQGKIIHSFEANEALIKDLVAKNLKVTVLGGSKTATDFILSFYKYGYKVTWLYRKNYWFFNFNIIDTIIKKAKKKSFSLLRAGFVSGYILGRWYPRISYWIWRVTGVIHTYGSKHLDFKKFHNGSLDNEQVSILKRYNNDNAVIGEIDELKPNGISLKNGTYVASDIIICCTGSAPTSEDFPKVEIDDEPIQIEKIDRVYRGRIIPKIPNLIFTAFHFFTTGTINGLITGNWIKNYILLQAETDYLEKNAKTYSKPFFLSSPLFDSSDYFLRKNNYVTEEFYKSGELDILKYAKWGFRDYLFGYQAVKPFIFNKIKKDNST